ncbi:hypothetical protein [Sphingobacterium sp. SRCM116780]|nr:hypothetical protein [Sphingobacterium sp. SRCM116780]
MKSTGVKPFSIADVTFNIPKYDSIYQLSQGLKRTVYNEQIKI